MYESVWFSYDTMGFLYGTILARYIALHIRNSTFLAQYNTLLIQYESCTLLILFLGVVVCFRVCIIVTQRVVLRTIPAGANLLKQRSTACSVVMFCLTSTAYNYNKKHIYIKWWKLCVKVNQYIVTTCLTYILWFQTLLCKYTIFQ